jgi:gas vesicle protein
MLRSSSGGRRRMTDDQMDEIKRHFNAVAENLLHEIRLIAEGHVTLDRKIERVLAESNEQHAEAMAMIRTVHDSLDSKIDSVRDELKGDLKSLRSEMKGDTASLRSELKGDMASLRSELKGDMDSLRSELKEEIDVTREELRREIRAVGEKVEGHEARLTALEKKVA